MTRAKQLRGGSWFYNLRDCRSASRDRTEPGYTIYDLGFRVVCNEDSPPSHKTLRGGSWLGIPWLCRSDSRAHGEPGVAVDFLGFRVVCNEKPSPSPM